jgi:uncharacterized metal-binding protein YceD (DUF177 family)
VTRSLRSQSGRLRLINNMKYEITIMCSRCRKEVKKIIEEHYPDIPKVYTKEDLEPVYCDECLKEL